MKKTRYLAALALVSAASTSWATMNIQPDPQNANGYIVSRADIEAAESEKTADPMYQIWAQALSTAPNTVVEAIDSGLVTNPDNVKRAERVFPQAEWGFLTHMAAPEYTYTRFLRAIGKFPAFCAEYTDGRDSDAICKRSIVTAFAHFSQETGGHIAKDNISDNPLALEEWQQALVHVREMGWSEGQEGYTTGCGQNDWQNKKWPCATGQGYFGRGAKQLSYHFNYGAFSEAMFDGDASVLLNNPGLVADSWLNLASAIWFFLTPQAPKPAMLHVIDKTWTPSQREIDAGIGYGFGTTINIINGGIECGEQNKEKGQPVNRIRYWEGLSDHYQIPLDPDEKNTCWQQTPYGSLNLNGATDVLYTNWDGNWKYYADRPGGYSFECELVGFQTAYSALVPGDYEKCVTNFYGSHAGWPQVRIVDTLEPSEPDQGEGSGWSVSKVYNTGDEVTHQGATYRAKWWTQGDDPSLGGPWELLSETPNEPVPEPTPDPEPAPEPEPAPTPDPDTFIEWQPGSSQVADGDKVTYLGKCFIAKNGPGVWESPTQSNWFWDEISCQ
ncbi:carbohydrate-binding protein [Vibrio galatheae]|uniref:Carbohydrate-binding protein n=1 Tax=Vibrio galatheae TaxID=579748 RepID=A0A0F4NQD9_9VIBR|nr:chitinase [Vibrio galatheae]KJY85094.1 carbohydrate-binding protein [Vibrio galatheae]